MTGERRSFREVLAECCELADAISGLEYRGIPIRDFMVQAQARTKPDHAIFALVRREYRFLCAAMRAPAKDQETIIDTTLQTLALHAAIMLSWRVKRITSLDYAIERLFEHCAELHERKDSDYASGIPYANFFASRLFGMEPEQAIMVRLSDKFQRVRSLLALEKRPINDRVIAVVDESMEDTLRDLVNYAVIAVVIRDLVRTETPEERGYREAILELRDEEWEA